MMAALATFGQMMISAAEYDEVGPSIVQRKGSSGASNAGEESSGARYQ